MPAASPVVVEREQMYAATPTALKKQYCCLMHGHIAGAQHPVVGITTALGNQAYQGSMFAQTPHLNIAFNRPFLTC